MGNLIFANGNHASSIREDVSALKHRVAQKAVSCQVKIPEFFLLVLIGWDTLYPAERRDHR